MIVVKFIDPSSGCRVQPRSRNRLDAANFDALDKQDTGWG